MNYVKRSEWGAKRPNSRPTRTSGIRGLSIHTENTDADLDTDECECAAAVRDAQTSHVSGGTYDIKHNWLVCPHGTIFEGRGWKVRNAGNDTMRGKDRYHTVAYLGDLTYEGKLGLKSVIDTSNKRFGKDVECKSDLDELCEWVEAGAPEPEKPEPTPEPEPEPESDPLDDPANDGDEELELEKFEDEGGVAHSFTAQETVSFRYKKVVQDGDAGYAVTEWQEKLHFWDDKAPEPNGFFGDETDHWTRKFQEEVGLEVDGVVGPETREMMTKEF